MQIHILMYTLPSPAVSIYQQLKECPIEELELAEWSANRRFKKSVVGTEVCKEVWMDKFSV